MKKAGEGEKIQVARVREGEMKSTVGVHVGEMTVLQVTGMSPVVWLPSRSQQHQYPSLQQCESSGLCVFIKYSCNYSCTQSTSRTVMTTFPFILNSWENYLACTVTCNTIRIQIVTLVGEWKLPHLFFFIEQLHPGATLDGLISQPFSPIAN